MASDDIYNLLNPLLDECMTYFRKDTSVTSTAFVQSLKSIHNNALHVRPIAVGLVAKVAHRFDASPDVKANGFRSLLSLLESLMHMIVANLQTICKERKNVFFRANQYSDKLRCLAQNLHQMRALFHYAETIIEKSQDGALLLTEEDSDDIMHDCEIMAKSCFYSHTQGFQYYAGIQPIIQALSMFTASFNDINEQSTVWKSTKSLFNSGKYVISPSVRGRQMEKIYSEADAKFFKAFFSLPEMGVGVMLPNLVGQTVQVNRIFNLPPSQFELDTSVGDKVNIKRTSIHGAAKCVKARLISNVLREGQDDPESPSLPDSGLDKSKVGFTKAKHQPKSKNLVFFCHGGGFIALSSKSYEMVLREWSKELDCPIFSIDYSHAPEAPFPEAFEECFYAYAWALKNSHMLGTTAENVFFVGDSAGGNLVLSVAMRAAAYDIQIPKSLLAIYPSCVVRYSASPSRLLAVMDPLLPNCMLCSCLCAYTGLKTEKVAYNREEQVQEAGQHSNNEATYDRPPKSPDNVSLSSPKHSITDTTIISTFVKDVGEGLSRLTSSSSAPGESNTWWDEELFEYENDYKPEKTQTPFTFSGFFKSIGERLTQAVSPSTITDVKNTFWEEEFDLISLEESDADSCLGPGRDVANTNLLSTDKNANVPPLKKCDTNEAHFKMQLPGGFLPLKSKYFGERTKVHHTALVKNPYISPALAPDDMLKTLPYVDIVGCELDPLFDDSITLARRLHNIQSDHQLHIVRGLPHGFLSLQACKETKEASKMCLQLIKDRMKTFLKVLPK